MRIKLDENLPRELAEDLHSLGHDAETVFSEGLQGSPDHVIVEAAGRERRVLWTMDKGIANVKRDPPEQFAGIILFRCDSTGRITVREFIRQHFTLLTTNDWTGKLAVIAPTDLRLFPTNVAG